MGKICSDLQIKQTNLPKYLKTLIDLDILEREVPVTENNPEKSKMGQYRIKDNFLRFWFRFVYPQRARLELLQISHISQNIKDHFIDSWRGVHTPPFRANYKGMYPESNSSK